MLWSSGMWLAVPFTRGSMVWSSSGSHVAFRDARRKSCSFVEEGPLSILAVTFLLRGRALLHIRLYCFSIDLQGCNYHFDIFFLRHSWILWIRSICYYPLLFDFILPLKCQGVWDGRRARLVWCGVNVQTADLQPLSEAAEHGDGFYDNEAAVSPTTFRVLWKGAMEVSRECSAVNSLT